MNPLDNPIPNTTGSLIFPTIRDWYNHVDSRKDMDELNAAVALLRKGRTNDGIHRFEYEGKMGLAVGALRQRAKKLNLYPLLDGTFRQMTPAMIEHETKRTQNRY